MYEKQTPPPFFIWTPCLLEIRKFEDPPCLFGTPDAVFSRPKYHPQPLAFLFERLSIDFQGVTRPLWGNYWKTGPYNLNHIPSNKVPS